MFFFFFNDTATTEIYTLSLHDALPICESIAINLLSPVYFIATKLEAWLGRGDNDPMRSHDLEDVINLVDGREELAGEILAAATDVRAYIAEQFQTLLEHPEFDYAIHGNLQDNNRADLFYQRWEQIAAIDSKG